MLVQIISCKIFCGIKYGAVFLKFDIHIAVSRSFMEVEYLFSEMTW
jgi:hypothetical protein